MGNSNSNPMMARWNAMARPPRAALKEIKGGRLAGMTDVNPQWRYQAMTEQYGPCGTGWRYTIDKLWTEPGVEGEVLGFAQISLYTRETIGDNGSYRESQPIVGIGGNHLVTKEKSGLRANDECWKMAVTDALSVAMKMLGVAADVYAGRWDGSKYKDEPDTAEQPPAARILPAEPQGFMEWWGGLQDVAIEGESALKAAWSASPAEHRRYLTSVYAEKWDALKKKAATTKALVHA